MHFSSLFIIAAVVNAVPLTDAKAAAHAPALCDNQGLEWAYYNNYYMTESAADDAAFDPTVIRTQTPIDQGKTSIAGYQAPASVARKPPYPGFREEPTSYFVLTNRGYLIAPVSGMYTIDNLLIDDIDYFWIGPPAYAGWNKGNTIMSLAFHYDPKYAAKSQATVYLNAFTYYPIRWVYKQGPSAADFLIRVTDPNGNILLSSDDSIQPTPWVVRFSCDGNLAPKFPAFGQE